MIPSETPADCRAPIWSMRNSSSPAIRLSWLICSSSGGRRWWRARLILPSGTWITMPEQARIHRKLRPKL